MTTTGISEVLRTNAVVPRSSTRPGAPITTFGFQGAPKNRSHYLRPTPNFMPPTDRSHS